MSIFTTIGNFIGGLFSGTNAANWVNNIGNALTGAQNAAGYPHSTGQAASGGLDYSQSGRNFPGSNSGQGDSGNNYSANQSYTPRYTPTPQGGGYTNQPGMTRDPNYTPRSSDSGGGNIKNTYVNSQPYVFDKNAGSSYLKSAGLNGASIDLTGKTEAEARSIVDAQKEAQRGQVTANTSAVFADPNSILNTSKKVESLMLGIDNIKNDPWTSTSTKSEMTKNLLQSTAKDIAVDYKTPQELAAAYHNDPVAKANLDKFIQAGGTDQMIGEAINTKTNTSAATNNMSVADYLASGAQDTNAQNMANLVPESKLIQDRIAQEAKIPENLKTLYFGDGKTTGLLQERINLAKQNIELLNTKMANEESNLRSQANYQIQKNNEELNVAKSTIEQNRLNAKNYLTGQLAKLGALQTTSAAAEGITILDQKYQQQTAEAESKVRFANQEIEIKLRDAINKVETSVSEKIQSVKEDLSKDQKDVLKEINTAQKASDKEIFNLTMKWTTLMKKNVEKYTNDATTMAENYTKAFQELVSGGFNPQDIATNLPVNIPKGDQQISTSARIKDPGAISLFKSLPAEFKYQWIDYANQQAPNRYFTREDIRQAYEAYQVDKNVPNATKEKAGSSSTTSISDITVDNN